MTTDTKEHKCARCGKIIKPGQEFTHQGKVYCCSSCCKNTSKASNVCELC